MSEITDPGMRPDYRAGFGAVPPGTKERETFFSTASDVWDCPDGVYWLQFHFAAPGGGGGSSVSTSFGGGGGGAGQCAIGRIAVIPGERYTYTQGAVGVGGAASSDSAGRNGSAGGTSSFIGAGVSITLLGGKAGLLDNSAGGVVGVPTGSPAIVVSPLGYTVYPGAAGGAGATGPGVKGSDTDTQFGGAGGVTANGGGGGGASLFGPGGAGGSTGVAGTTASANTGAGGGGSGAGSGTASVGGGSGSGGFFRGWFDV